MNKKKEETMKQSRIKYGRLLLIMIIGGIVGTSLIQAKQKVSHLEQQQKEVLKMLKSIKLFKILNAPVLKPLRNPPERHSIDGVLDTRLEINYAENLVWNMKQKSTIKVKLRSYEGGLMGPTLRVRPGDLLKVHLVNNLPKKPVVPNQKPVTEHITPYRFNVTNLHTHGLHVSPAGNSDNVLIEIGPKDSFRNEINIPSNHPAGTFWYHAHVHGSTAIQVSNGMAGAIIMEGGLDEVPEIKAAEEKIFVFQQIPYLPVPELGEDTYGVEDFEEAFGPGTWEAGVEEYGWRTMINGQTYPIIHMRPGEVQRWRFIDAGVREAIGVRLTGHKFHEIANDGLAFGRIDVEEKILLYPGYRSDVLVKAKENIGIKVDDYRVLFLWDAGEEEEEAGQGEHSLQRDTNEFSKLLAVVIISGDRKNMALPTSRDLAKYAPHKSISDDEVKGYQRIEFNIETGGERTLFTVNGKEFDINNPPRELKLDSADEWTLTSGLASHPFHIHVNPFEIISVTNADGETDKSVKVPLWKDTILIQQGQTIKFRSRYEVYIGQFVLHCHILDHEDQGMMELVEIVPKGEQHHKHTGKHTH
jgi:FtsP/CotA-like multicopper oxidase with cupredoxin domain